MADCPMTHMAKTMLHEFDPVAAIPHSFLNYHVRGLHYVNLARTPQMTVKLYVFDKVQHNFNGFMVWPHNHRYRFSHFGLVGTIRNHLFADVPGPGWCHYRYDADNGQSMEFQGYMYLEQTELQEVGPGDHYLLDTHEIHTISTYERFAAAMLIQYRDQKADYRTHMYAPTGARVSCGGEGLYQVPTPDDLQDCVTAVLERIL